MRRLCMFGVVAVAALTGAGAPHAQGPTSQPRVWTGTWEEHDAWEGHSKYGRQQAQISFVYVQGRDEFGLPRWDSRRLTWNAVWEEHSFDTVALWEGPPDDRGFTMRRYRQDIDTYCTGGGTLELGPNLDDDALTPEQQAQIRPTCVTTYHPRDGSVPTPAPTTSSGDELPAPSLPNEDQLTGCAYEKSWPKGGRPAGSFSVSVSAPVTAVMEVDPQGDYGRFVPVPGQRLTFTASVPTGTARFRFELDPEATSHFPGYATNANVDDAFFVKHDLGHLRGTYANDGPDVIFDARNFGRQEWVRIEPLVVETRSAQSGAVVTITAMDYGAVGKLRGFVKSEQCGDWVPIPIRVGAQTRDGVAIPIDEDNNLMADALEAYRGRDSGADDDAEPKGNGIAGDGLTAFEEYRGFLIRGAGCPVAPEPVAPGEPVPEPFPQQSGDPSDIPGLDDVHIRTPPSHKNFFVHTLDPELAVLTADFGWATDLSVHVICEPHYVDNATRIVNFTLQQAGMRAWRGKRISQDHPQHGTQILAVHHHPQGIVGAAEPLDHSSDRFGPPAFSLGVLIYKPFRIEAIGDPDRHNLPSLRSALTHELAHVVGVPHHSDRVENWRLVRGKANVTPTESVYQRDGGAPPQVQTDQTRRAREEADLGGLLVLGTDCDEWFRMYREGRFVGCWAEIIARRGQQNSGDFECPLRYVSARYYEPPGSTAVYRWTAYVGGPGPGHMNVDAWEGRLLRYHIDLDREGKGKLCTRTRGTEINALPGDMNHNGDAGRAKPCAEFLVVNDVAAAGVR